MSKIAASSVFGLVAVPTAIAAATRDKGSVKATESGRKTKCDRRMLIAILATIALAGVAASVVVARASALLPSLRLLLILRAPSPLRAQGSLRLAPRGWRKCYTTGAASHRPPYVNTQGRRGQLKDDP
jgi:hypothetical protein